MLVNDDSFGEAFDGALIAKFNPDLVNEYEYRQCIVNAKLFAHARTDISKLVSMLRCARDRLNTLLNACEVCVGLNDTGSLRAKATKMHIEDTFAELDRIAARKCVITHRMFSVKYEPCGHKTELHLAASTAIPPFCPECLGRPKHSRGPWLIEHQTGRVVMLRDEQVIPVCAVGDYVNENGNRPLLAAAPDLFDACFRALKEAKETDNGDTFSISIGCFEDMIDALQKAQGVRGGLPRGIGKEGLSKGLCLECGQGARHCVCIAGR